MNIKVFTAYHEPAILFKNKFIEPVNGGRVYLSKRKDEGKISDEDYEWLLKNTISDATGDNISLKNNTYNELTILYWVWKNYLKKNDIDYIGLMHYRRHFILNDSYRPKDDRWTVDIDRITIPVDQYLSQIGMTEERIQQCLQTHFGLVACYDYKKATVYEHYKNSKYHNITDLDNCINIIRKKYPQYSDACDQYLNGTKQYFCNMFILNKEVFSEYCSFIFGVLKCLENIRDIKDSSYIESRLYVSERLTGIFIKNLINKGCKLKEVPITFVKDVSIDTSILPAFQKNNIPVVFSVDNNYLKYLKVTLISMMENSNPCNNYDVIILHDCVEDGSQKEFIRSFKCFGNLSVRFLDLRRYITLLDRESFYIEIHVSISTYFRFFIPDILKEYSKVLYLDSDIIILGDVAELYNNDVNGYLLGAVQDIREGIASKYNMIVSNRNWRDYVVDILGCHDWRKYFQAGVLLFNLDEMREEKISKQLLQRLKEVKSPILSDQDILNSVCYNRVKYLPVEWNIEWQILFEFPDFKDLLPVKQYELFSRALSSPKIVHYASSIKPWLHPELTNAHYWWRYARKSPEYEILLKSLVEQNIPKGFVYKKNKTKIRSELSRIARKIKKIYHK